MSTGPPFPDLTLYDADDRAVTPPADLELSTRGGLYAALHARVRQYFDAQVEALFTFAHDHLFAEARGAASDNDQRACFDAMQELHGLKSAVQKGFVDAISAAMDQLWSAEVGAATHAESADAEELSLVDTQSLEDQVAAMNIAARVQASLRAAELRVTERLSRLFPVELDEESNPLRVGNVCLAFQAAVRDLGAERWTRRALFAGLEATVVRNLATLHAELEALLADSGDTCTPLPRTGPASRGGRTRQSVREQSGSSPAARPRAAANPAPAATGAISKAHDAAPGVPFGAATGVARRLLAFERAAAPATTTPLAAPAVTRPGIDAALARIQACEETMRWGEKGPFALAVRLRRALTQDGVVLEDRAVDEALEVVSNLFECVLADPLVHAGAKSMLRRVGIPVARAALTDGAFFTSEAHPARLVIDRLGRLAVPALADADGVPFVQVEVTDVVDALRAAAQPDRAAFAEAAARLDALLGRQQSAFEQGAARLTAEMERQRKLLRAREDESPRAVPELSEAEVAHEDWVHAIEAVTALERGDVLVFPAGAAAGGGPAIPGPVTLAWRSSDAGVLVFADACGRRAASFAGRELAMGLRRGWARIDAAAGMSIIDRAMCSVLQQLHSGLRRKANRDALTGLANRKLLVADVQRAMHEPTDGSLRHHLCVLGLSSRDDITQRFGAKAVQRLVKRYAQLVERQFGADRTIAYLGNGRYAVLIERATRADVLQLVERHRRSIEFSQCEYRGESIPLAVSIGVVTLAPGAEDPAKAIDSAEQAQAQARQASPTGLQVQEVMVGATVGQIDIAELIAAERLTLRCQRVEPLASGDELRPYYEVLLGVRDANGRVGPPAEVVLAAERSGQGAALDRWVIARTLRWMAAHAAALDDLAGFAINLSGRTLNERGMTQFVRQEIASCSVPPERIMFEVTESTAIEQPTVAREFIQALRDLGCRFAIDDFGSGHASFSYLKLLPVDTVKIDGLFVKDMVTDPSDEAMVRSIHDIAALLGKRTVAEFVENEATKDRLRAIGVDYAQGYGVEAPILIDALLPCA